MRPHAAQIRLAAAAGRSHAHHSNDTDFTAALTHIQHRLRSVGLLLGSSCGTMLRLSAFLLLSLLVATATAAVDADKAAELSREVREHFRRSGANWVSPVMLKHVSRGGAGPGA
jgi:hypothetical protein